MIPSNRRASPPNQPIDERREAHKEKKRVEEPACNQDHAVVPPAGRRPDRDFAGSSRGHEHDRRLLAMRGDSKLLSVESLRSELFEEFAHHSGEK